MKVKDVMTVNVSVCRPDENLAQAASTMWNARCGVLPVIGAGGAVASMITDRDICIALGTRDRRAAELQVADVALPRVFTCRPDDEIRAALNTMISQNVRRLPVVDEAGRLEGILSLDDVLLQAGPASGVSYVEVMEAARSILRERFSGGRHAPAELIAAN